MVGGSSCAVCALPIVDDIVAWRRDGTSVVVIHDRIKAAGFTKITRANLDYCLRAAAHHGDMPTLGSRPTEPDPTVGLAKLLADAGINPQLASQASKITVRGPKEWQGFFKTPEGDAEVEIGRAHV